MSVSKLHAFRHQRESEYHKLVSVSEVTIVVEVWGEVVAVATLRIGTRLAGYGPSFLVSLLFAFSTSQPRSPLKTFFMSCTTE